MRLMRRHRMYQALIFGGLLMWAILMHACSDEITPEASGVSDTQLLWPNAVIYYQISESLSAKMQQDILSAMVLWSQNTVIHFEAIAADAHQVMDYVLFIPAAGKTCASSTGRMGGQQVLRLAPRCGVMEIAHELGHLIGLWHEQARMDRDEYIDILWHNIRPDHVHNFAQRFDEARDLGPYDYDSIMHYSAYAFSQNGKPTIVPRVPGVTIGQRSHISCGDAEQVNQLYQKQTATRF